jgi:ornithine cyclodeaminase/alanine dehydrogenase-like protein (mu-crystallin family)
VKIITADAEKHLDWLALTDAIVKGHARPKAEMQDVVLKRIPDTMLSRHAWIDGLGSLVKTAMVFPGNADRGLPSVNGQVTLFSDSTGEALATLDFRLLTKWKTAATSLLAARRLARAGSREILIIGAGTVAQSLIEAYTALFPKARFQVWNRTSERAEQLASANPDVPVKPVINLAEAVGSVDIISCCTMSSSPVLKGDWLQPGQHVDLIGAYLPEMREADDHAMRRAHIFVDSFDTTLNHIGELIDPLASGAICRADVLADFYDLNSGKYMRNSDSEITLFKNGGGAHLDLITAAYMLRVCR